MIKVENISKNFAGQELFKEFSFILNKGEKIGLVGRNGHGKTTLLKIITRELQPDSGQIIIPKNYKIGYLKQHINFSSNSILEEVLLNLNNEDSNNEWKAKKILTGLGFSEEDFLKSPKIFSGGYQLRINLAKILLFNPDLLLLDEPNNYLDIVAIRWLEIFLKSLQSELILITHDRSFMDNIVTHTLCIHRQKAKKIEGNTKKLYEQIEQEEHIHEKTRLNEEKKRHQTEIFISKFRAKARLGGMVQSRIKSLEKSEIKEKLNKIENLEFNFNYHDFNANQMMEAIDISFAYENKPKIISNLNLSISKNDRIAIIGKNGKGKSTLLKLLAEILHPNQGKINKHTNLKPAYFGQTNLSTLSEEKTILDELLFADPDNSIQKCRNIAGTLMFTGDNALKKINILSGGEKNRVMLGKILLTPANLLFLDEPTNHLDMDSSEALLNAINQFKGAVIMVTHNEAYLDNFAQKLIIFDNNDIKVLNNTYKEFLDKIGWGDEINVNINKQTSTSKILQNKNKNIDKILIKKQKAEIIQAKSQELLPINNEINDLESKITESEIEIEKINNEIIKVSISKNTNELKNLSQNLKKIKTNLTEYYNNLEKLYITQEITTKKFQNLLIKFE